MSQVPYSSTKPEQEKLPFSIKRLIACSKFPVYHAHSTDSKKEYAVKVFPQELTTNPLFMQEHAALTSANHPNIIRYLFHRKANVRGVTCNMLVTEYAPYGDFFDLVMSKGLKDMKELIVDYFHQLIAGIEYMHSEQNIAHCDLKLENIMVGEDYSLKIIDFDQAHDHTKILCNDSSHLYGTEGYRAPEIIDGACRNLCALDIYAAGVLLYVFITGEMPFLECKRSNQRIVQGYELFCNNNEIFWSKKAARHQSTILLDKDLQDLINGMLAKDPNERFTMTQVKGSKWFNNWIKNDVILKKQLKKIFMQEEKN